MHTLVAEIGEQFRILFEPTCAFCTWAHTCCFLSVCPSVYLGVPRAHYTPLQRYMGYLCTRKAQYAPSRRNMHHGAQGRLCIPIFYLPHAFFHIVNNDKCCHLTTIMRQNAFSVWTINKQDPIVQWIKRWPENSRVASSSPTGSNIFLVRIGKSNFLHPDLKLSNLSLNGNKRQNQTQN